MGKNGEEWGKVMLCGRVEKGNRRKEGGECV